MKLYRWSSQYLGAYSEGDIIVVAPDVETARRLAHAEFQRHVKDTHLWMYDCIADVVPADEDFGDYAKEFQADIAKEPEVIESRAVFIKGSE